MVVFIAGATGFIGRRVAEAFTRAGHEVVHGVRDPRKDDGRDVGIDYTRDLAVRDWRPRLQGVDAVVNAVGILRERENRTFQRLHVDAPRALFAASVEAGVRKIVQISALGADEMAQSRYHRTKKEADDFLASLPVAHAIVQPSLVFGPDGASARLFALIASLPFVPVPGSGAQQVQPVHIDDLVACIVAWTIGDHPSGRIPIVGPSPLKLRAFLDELRHALGLGPARFLGVPLPTVRFAARIGDHLPDALLDSEALGMLERGNVADAGPTRRLLGRMPRPVAEFVDPRLRPAARSRAKLDWLLPMLRLAIAAVWIVTAVVSLGVFPVAESYALLARVGVPAGLQPAMLYGAATLDLALGVATIGWRRHRALWLAQMALILLYTALITWRLPEFWLHPYGPILKNLPMLGALWLLYELDDR